MRKEKYSVAVWILLTPFKVQSIKARRSRQQGLEAGREQRATGTCYHSECFLLFMLDSAYLLGNVATNGGQVFLP